ncbi:MAG: hypothetical protein JWM78_1978 [Verrucomicrobiaceae bacterium]|nr:hypothetical protein [Verrucomicrobiaceae bacterium]
MSSIDAAPYAATSRFAANGSQSTARLRRLAVAVLLIWGLAMLGFFFHFYGANPLVDNLKLVHFDAALLPATPHVGAINAVYFVDGECPCSRNLRAQIETFQHSYGASLQQSIVAAADRAAPTVASTIPLDIAVAKRLRAAVPAFPAVAIWDASGKLAYFGPLAAGLDCGAASDSFVSATLRRLSRGQTPVAAPADAVGCFCSTPGSSPATY